MKLTFIKFFQAVHVPIKSGAQTFMTGVSDKEHLLTLDGTLITIKAKSGGDTVISTLNNVQYMKVDNETADAKTKKGANDTGSPKKES